MKQYTRVSLAFLVSTCLAGTFVRAAGLDASGQAHVPGNLIKNPSFEQNWFNRKLAERRRFLLLQATDMGVGESDGHVDHWQFRGLTAIEAWDTDVARSGSRSVRFDKPGPRRNRIGNISTRRRYFHAQTMRKRSAFYRRKKC